MELFILYGKFNIHNLEPRKPLIFQFQAPSSRIDQRFPVRVLPIKKTFTS